MQAVPHGYYWQSYWLSNLLHFVLAIRFYDWPVMNTCSVWLKMQDRWCSNIKLSFSKTALKRWTKTEIRWNKKLVDRSSPVLSPIFRPRLLRNSHADSFRGPNISTTTGWKSYWAPIRPNISPTCEYLPVQLLNLLLWPLAQLLLLLFFTLGSKDPEG